MRIDSSIAAIVVGGASGLGAATARALAAEGARVAIFDLAQQQTKGTALAAELGGTYVPVDIIADGELENAFARARAAHGQERILVNCAGIGSAMKTVSRDRASGEVRYHSLEAFSRVIRINLIGTFDCIARSAAGMLTLERLADGERGVIVNTASVAAEDGQIGQAAYSASKAGIAGMTLPIARDLMSEGIRVNTILPGTFNTPLLQSLPDDVKAGLAAAVPFPKRLGEPSEFADVVSMLVRVGYLNGAQLRLDGAIRMPPR